MPELLASWLAFPLALSVLCVGCGLAVEALVATRIPGPLIPATGFAAIVVLGQFLTLADETAELTMPVLVGLALVGGILALVTRRAVRIPPPLAIAAAAVFAVYAAPIVLSGEPTLAGYIKLDDTATWLAFTDHVMEHGRDLDGVRPSSYEATLAVNIGEGYPVGAFIGLGAVSELLGVDPAFLVQPYLAFLAVLLALGAWALLRPLIPSPGVRAAVVVIAVQPALLFGYYLWGGVKEVAAAALIATAAGLAAVAVARADDWRPLMALALATAALVGVLSAGGLVWLLPVLVGASVALAPKLRPAALAARAGAFAAAVALAALPVILPGGLLPPTASPLDAGDAMGNLFEPLDPLQVAGIWPVGDFRLAPEAEPLTYTLVALVLVLAMAGTSYAWRRRAHGALFVAAGAVIGVAFLVAVGSPWVDGKALATASPFVLLIALVGAVALAAGPWRAAGVGAGVVIASAVLWSNALAYRDASLAPYDQFLELERVAEEIAGEGPTLMTEYSPYGARHFLRDADPEAVSELRRREIPLRSGGTVEKGYSTDTDRIDPGALGVYRTLVLRRSPGQSRPPSAYELAWSGEFYEVWQRPQTAVVPAERLPLGSRRDPLAEPSCAAVLHLARGADALVGATGAEPVVVSLVRAEYPDGWRVAGLENTPLVAGDGTLAVAATIRRAGAYELWAEGSARSEVETFIDGERVGSVRHELNNEGQYIRLGSADLEAGRHRIELRFAGADLHPGSGGRPLPLGPLALTAGESADSRLVHVPATEARRLCGREWDWIEVAPG